MLAYPGLYGLYQALSETALIIDDEVFLALVVESSTPGEVLHLETLVHCLLEVLLIHQGTVRTL